MTNTRWLSIIGLGLCLALLAACGSGKKTVDMAAVESAEEITVPEVDSKVADKDQWGEWSAAPQAPGVQAATAPSAAGGTETAASAPMDQLPGYTAATQEPLPPISRPSARRIPVDFQEFGYLTEMAKPTGTEDLISEISKDVAGKVFYSMKETGDEAMTSKVAVVIAVPLADFKRETEFGRVIAEYLMTDLADRGLQVTELRLGSEINILPLTGEFILTRNIGELANNAPEIDYVLVSTFSNTRKTLILQGRLVSLKTGLVKTSWRHTLPVDRELTGLFHTTEKPFTIAVKGIGR